MVYKSMISLFFIILCNVLTFILIKIVHQILIRNFFELFFCCKNNFVLFLIPLYRSKWFFVINELKLIFNQNYLLYHIIFPYNYFFCFVSLLYKLNTINLIRRSCLCKRQFNIIWIVLRLLNNFSFINSDFKTLLIVNRTIGIQKCLRENNIAIQNIFIFSV